MPEFLDWLLTDPTSPGGGMFARLLDPSAATKTPLRPAAPSGYRPTAGYGAGLLGNSPIANMLRGGLAGWAGASGYRGFAPQLGAGALAAMKYNRDRQLQTLGRAPATEPRQQIEQGPGCSCEGATPSTLPTPGEIVSGYRFRGGDPSDASNWDEVR